MAPFGNGNSSSRRRILERKWASSREATRQVPSRTPVSWRTVVVAGVFALAAATLIDFYGTVPANVRPNERLRSRYTARVPFTFLNEQGTAEAREKEYRRQPNVYREVPGWSATALRKWWASLTDARARRECIRSSPPFPPEVAAGLRELDEALGPGAEGERILEALDSSGKKVLAHFWEKGILSDRAFQTEKTALAEHIVRRRPALERSEASEGRAGPADPVRETKPPRASLYSLTAARERAAGMLAGFLQEAESAGSPPLSGSAATAAGFLLGLALDANLRYEEELTRASRRAAAEKVPPLLTSYSSRDTVIRSGDHVNRQAWLRIMAECRAWWLSSAARRSMALRLGAFFALSVGILLLFRRLRLWMTARNERPPVRSALVLALLTLVVLGGSKALIVRGLASPYVTPGGLIAVLATLAASWRAGVVFSLAASLWMGLVAGVDVALMIGLAGGSLAASFSAAGIHRRRDVLLTGVRCAVAHGVAILVASLALSADALGPEMLLTRAGWGLINGVGVGLFLSATLPVFETTMRLTTDISLLEWSDQNHPVLSEIGRRAPGTYQHSFRVGILAEAAAEAVGANPLLAQVGAYYHDLGKCLRPEYFGENEAGAASRHDELTPELSTLIVLSHVKDGVGLARSLDLPRAVVDLVEQHHGTTLVEYFYHRAVERAGSEPAGPAPPKQPRLRRLEASTREGGSEPAAPRGDHPAPDRTREFQHAAADMPNAAGMSAPPEAVSPEFFRYSGPKPQTHEAAIILLADSVEAASRSLSRPSPQRLRNLIHALATERLADGQFSECGLTLEELEAIEEALARALISMFHPRRQYPSRADRRLRG